MKALLLEAFEPVAAWIELPGFAERGAQIAHHEPSPLGDGGRARQRGGDIVNAVVAVLQIGAVQHQQDDEQPLQFARAAERIVRPAPDVRQSLQRGEFRAEAGFAFLPFTKRPGGKVVNRRLAVPESPQDARDDHLGLRFRSDLRAPLDAIGARHVVADAETGRVFRDQLVGGVRRRCVAAAADAPEQVTRRGARIDAQFRHLSWRERHAWGNDHGAAAAGHGHGGEHENHGRACANRHSAVSLSKVRAA